MQDAGDADSGGLEKAPPSEDTTVELRKSCDYCVRLKRACDGKNPCSLCLRRHKPCTRSARKKSGPAKGTKYAPRRKRSAIAEWADRAAVGQTHDLPGGLGGGEGPLGRALGHLPLPPGGASAGMNPFLGSHGAPGRHGGEPWGDPAALAESRVRRGEVRLPPGSPMLPFSSERFVKQEAPGRRRLAPRLGPPTPIGVSPEALSRRRYAPAVAWSAPSMDSVSRSGRPGLDAAAGPGGSAGQGGKEHSAAPQPRSLPMEPRQGRMWDSPPGESEAFVEGERGMPGAGIERRRERTWDPSPAEWAGQSDAFARSPGVPHTKHLRLSPPSLPPDAGRSLPRPFPDAHAPAASPRGVRMDSGPGARSPDRRRDSGSRGSSALFHPSPIEPPDPTAGFTFRPANKLLAWRRSPHVAPRETRGDSGAQARETSPPFDYSDRPTSWSSGDGGWGSSGGAAGGGGGSGGSASGDAVGSRRYREDFRGGAGSAGQEVDAAEWRGPQGETEGYRERLELPPPSALDRHQPRERPLVGISGDEREKEVQAAERWRGGSPSGLTLEGPRQGFPRPATSSGPPFERQLERFGGRFPSARPSSAAAAAAAADHMGERPGTSAARLESARQILPPDRQDWESYPPAVEIVSTPLVPPLQSGGGASGAGTASTPTRDGRLEDVSTATGFLEGARGPESAFVAPRHWESDLSARSARAGGGGGGGSSGGLSEGAYTFTGAASTSTSAARTALERGAGRHGDIRVAPLLGSPESVRSQERTSPVSSTSAGAGEERRGGEGGDHGGRALPRLRASLSGDGARFFDASRRGSGGGGEGNAR